MPVVAHDLLDLVGGKVALFVEGRVSIGKSTVFRLISLSTFDAVDLAAAAVAGWARSRRRANTCSGSKGG